MIISKKGGGTSTKSPERPMLDNEKVRGIPKEIFRLVITTMVDHFDVSRIIIVVDNSCDVMY